MHQVTLGGLVTVLVVRSVQKQCNTRQSRLLHSNLWRRTVLTMHSLDNSKAYTDIVLEMRWDYKPRLVDL